jgi:hypothetical protein
MTEEDRWKEELLRGVLLVRLGLVLVFLGVGIVLLALWRW